MDVDDVVELETVVMLLRMNALLSNGWAAERNRVLELEAELERLKSIGLAQADGRPPF